MVIRPVLLLVSLLCFTIAEAGDFAPISVSKAEATRVADSLERMCGNNKRIPEKFRLAFYYALSYYPELIHLKITLKEKSLKSTMAARPKGTSVLFRSKGKRQYRIFSNADSSHASPQYHEFTFNAQIGLIGHELAHLLHYLKRGGMGLVGEAFRYRKEEFKSKYEKQTDSITVARGLGWQCYDFASQMQANPRVPEDYKKRKEKLYFSAREIFSLMGDLGYDL